MARIFNPPHLGLTLRDDVLPAPVLNGRAANSPEMALRIEAWLGFCAAEGGDARTWLAQQSAYDLWQAQQGFKAAPMRVKPAPVVPEPLSV